MAATFLGDSRCGAHTKMLYRIRSATRKISKVKRGAHTFGQANSDGRPLDPDYLREQVLYPVLQAAGIKRKARENGFHAFRHAAGSILY
jgi:hypothetical protein